MRTNALSVLTVLCLMSALAVSSCASAESRAILAGDSYSVEVELSVLDFLTYSWSSDIPLSLTLQDPSGYEVPLGSNTTSGEGTLPSWEAGTYTLTWHNYASYATAHLDFDLSEPYDESGVEDAMSAFVMIGIIVVVVLIAVVVVIVLVVVMGNKKEPAQQAPPPMASRALETGHCPTCGSPIDKDASFCARCGAKFR
ncbi:MAG: zinc ribbon domain-containing protein [Thermoplasmata archaeon]